MSAPGLLQASENGRYFATADGNPVYLAGFHTWTDLQDLGSTFDWNGFLNLEAANKGNLVRLWVTDSATDHGRDYSPMPYMRMADGRYDLNSFNQEFFDTLRERVIDLGNRGMYADVMFFNGWSLGQFGDDGWLHSPWRSGNNVNGINGDPHSYGNGFTVQTLENASINAFQKAFIRKVVDSVDDLTNVIFEVGNESKNNSATWKWQNAMLDYAQQYDASKGLDHLVGMTASYPDGNLADINTQLYASKADWVSPNGWQNGYTNNPPAANGSKVSIVDSDHVFGVGGGVDWVWQQFTRGHNVMSMDSLTNPRIAGKSDTLDSATAAKEDGNRLGIKETRSVADMLDLRDVVPHGELASTGYAIADPAGGQYVVYAPSGGTVKVNLSGAGNQAMDVTWVNIKTGTFSSGGTVNGGSSSQSFSAPYGDAALVLTPHAGGSNGGSPATGGSTTPVAVTPASLSFGSGADTLVLKVSQDAYLGDAQYSVKVDGVQLGGSFTAKALHGSGSDTLTLKGDWAAGSHKVTVSLLNDAWGGDAAHDRNVYVDAASYNGVAIGGAALSVQTDRTPGSFGFTDAGSSGSAAGGSTAPYSTAIGSGSHEMVVKVSQDAWQGAAQYTLAVNGQQIGGTLTAAALHGSGQSDLITLRGDWGDSGHTLTVKFLNDAWGGTAGTDRNLYVDGVVHEGATVANSSASLMSAGSTAIWCPPEATGGSTGGTGGTATTIGSGSHQLVLKISEDAWQGDAQYTIKVDGVQVGGTQTAHAAHGAGQSDVVTVLGNWGAGSHSVAVSFLNDAWGGTAATDRNLYVDAISYDGNAVAGGSKALMSAETASFGFGSAGAGTGAGSIQGGSGADTLAGGAGGDIIIGGRGNDNLTGKGGADTFVFAQGDGPDWLNDFTPGTDHIQLVGVSASTVWTKQVSYFGASGLDVHYGSGSDSVFLKGVTALVAGDILYA